ncbi:methyltransferase domain-containing protein [Polluticaenibacter yanchengensis]|uniref:Methyltransferase domain-containing protein n=1 Tax=Polluticaenibacter yanchengensis TaxID=3014562 RepID=A0ABT4UJD3_9BACT|nr:methyltransferase domain-containing protein [Chitinophagaceae bacterium LY-5]
MPWNPEIYNQFKAIRYRPFFDLMALINNQNLRNCVDVGCGTGEQTSILSQKFESSHFTGIDASEEMLAESKQFKNERLKYRLSTIEAFADSASKWDLIFSNAALQWSDSHRFLFPKLISKLNKKGQFAVQMPFQKENALNMILHEMVIEKPFSDDLHGFIRHSPVLSLDDYAEIMFDNGLSDIKVSLNVYPIIAQNEMDLYNFISGSALIPYMELLDTKKQELFKSEFLKRINSRFSKYPSIYSFKRVLLYGVKS